MESFEGGQLLLKDRP